MATSNSIIGAADDTTKQAMIEMGLGYSDEAKKHETNGTKIKMKK